jgi:hypothetical protein
MHLQLEEEEEEEEEEELEEEEEEEDDSESPSSGATWTPPKPEWIVINQSYVYWIFGYLSSISLYTHD